MFEEQRRDRQLIERGVMDVLGDTFSIYWRHFRKFIVLVAVIQIPIAVAELLLSLVAPDSDWALVGVSVIDAMASMLVYGAMIFAVGQHLLTDDVSVERSYIRVVWRIVSVAIPALIVGALFAALMWQAVSVQGVVEPATTETPLETEAALSVLLGAGIVVAVMVALLIFTIYLVAIMPAIIVEGYRSTSAFGRASELLRGSKLRVLGHLLIYGFVVLGLFFTLSIPSFVLGSAISGEAQSFVASAIGIVLNRIVSILIAPVTFIATTLLYYDLRIRKENYDMERLSTEMGYERA